MMVTAHKLDEGTWKTGKPPVKLHWIEQIYQAIGRRFPIYHDAGKFLYMEESSLVDINDLFIERVPFTVGEKVTIKAILEEHGVA